ncbi:MAG: hypothetical protein U9N73_10360, partial [Candidatus Auribacterota bacterium]|nr:hypothetical protein [Candidatus Auribacterota bacterium]
ITGVFTDISVRNRVMVTLIYALGTLAFPFSTVFYGHQLAASVSIISFYILLKLKTGGGKESYLLLLLSGFLAGYAFLSDYPAGISMVLLGIYALIVLRRKSAIIPWMIGVALPVGFFLYYNNVCFGSPFVSSYSLHQTYSHSKGLLGITWPALDALWGITFSSYRGIFYQSPVLLFALPGFYLFHRRREYRAEFGLSLLVVLGFFFFNSGYAYWDGVGSVGPRFLIPAIPFLILPLVRSAKKWPLPVALLGVLSIIIMLVVTATEPRAEWKVRSPVFYFSFFLFLKGYLAENLGALFGMKKIAGILPLLIFFLAAFLSLVWITRDSVRRKISREKLLPSFGLLGIVLLWLIVAGWEEPCLQEFDKAESLFRYYRGRGDIRWSEVEGYYNRAIKADPGFLDPYLRLAEIARMRGRPRMALAHYKRLSHLYPGLVLLHQEMAITYDQLGETAKAEDELLLTIELSPKNAFLRNQLAAFYIEKGRRDEAIAQWEKSLRINPGDKKIQMRLDNSPIK